MEVIAVLLAAFLHAAWNGLLKHSDNQTRSLIVNRCVAALTGLVFLIFLPPLEPSAWPYLLAASAIHLVYFFSLLGAYKNGDFSQVYPVSRGLAPVIILLLSLVMGIDSISFTEALGVFIVSLGILLLARGNITDNVKSLAFAGLTAFCIAGYTLASGIGVRASGDFLIYAAHLELVSGSLFVASASVFKWHQLGWNSYSIRLAGRDCFGGAMAIFGFGVALWAMASVSIATVSALRETSVIFAVLIAWFLLKETQAKGRIIAVVMVALGVAVISYS